jgi:hypothetical protein
VTCTIMPWVAGSICMHRWHCSGKLDVVLGSVLALLPRPVVVGLRCWPCLDFCHALPLDVFAGDIQVVCLTLACVHKRSVNPVMAVQRRAVVVVVVVAVVAIPAPWGRLAHTI